MEILCHTATCEREAGGYEPAAKRLIQLLEISRRHPSEIPRQKVFRLDSLQHLSHEAFRVGKNDECLGWLKEGWELCREISPATYFENKDLETYMQLMAANYAKGLQLMVSEEASAKIAAEAEQLRERITKAGAEKSI